MSVFTKRAIDVFAPADASGNPRGASMGEVMVWGTELERATDGAEAGRVDQATWSGLDAIDGTRAGQPGMVLGPDAGTHTDPVTGATVPNEGQYYWSVAPEGWRRTGSIQRDLVHALNSGGTADAVEAASDGQFDTSPYRALITVNFTAANTGSMTLSIDGETPRPLVTNTGEPIPAGYVSAGMSALVQIDSAGNYRLFSYGDAAAVQAIIEDLLLQTKAVRDAAQGYAADAAAASGLTAFATVSSLLTDNNAVLGYTGSGAAVIVDAGTPVTAEGYRYTVADAAVTDHDVTTAGGVKLYVEAAPGGVVDQYQFAAVGDGAADDTAILKKLHAYCEATGAEYKYKAGIHKLTSNLTVRTSGSMAAATFNASAIAFSALADKTVLRIGDTDKRYHRLNVECPDRVFNTDYVAENWSSFADTIGIDFCNLNNCNVSGVSTYGFYENLRVSAYTIGNVYNNYFLKGNSTGLISLHLYSADETGWVNQNSFYGGSVGTGFSATTAGARYLLMDRSAESIALPPNNNNFYGVSFEGDNVEVVLEIWGRCNGFFGCRYEGSGDKRVILHSTEASSNGFYGGHSLNTLTFETPVGETPFANVMTGGRVNVFGGQYESLRLGLLTGSIGSTAYLTTYPSGVDPLTKSNLSTDWIQRLDSFYLRMKGASDAYDKVRLGAGSLYFGPGTADPDVFLTSTGNAALIIKGHLRPAADNAYLIGTSAAVRYAGGYLAAAMTVTSDAREKDWRGGLNEAELRVAKRLSELIGLYRWNKAVAEKGEAARQHCGVKAQDVQAAFEAEGLDGFAYGLLCFDEWDDSPEERDEEGNVTLPALSAGDRYGIRYDELWAFVAAGFEARLAALESE